MENAPIVARNWWALVLRGFAAIVFGILAFVLPGPTLAGLVLLFGAYAMVDGIVTMVAAAGKRKQQGEFPWYSFFFEGILGVIAGLVTFFWPGITAMVLLYVIAGWALITGALEIGAAVRLRREIKGEWLLGLAGVLSIVFGLALIAWPLAGALTVIWMIGGYAIAFGLVLAALGFRLRSLHPTGHGDDPSMRKTLAFR